MRVVSSVFIICLTSVTVSACGGNDLSGIGDVGTQGDARFNAVLDAIAGARGIPALGAMAVSFESPHVLDIAVAGSRTTLSSTPVTVDDLWHVGSLTKAMTATLAGRLVDRGIVNWTTTVAEVFPDLIGVIRPEYENVRLDELLYHVSGLPSDVTVTPLWPTLRTDPAPVADQRRRWSAELLSLQPTPSPGAFNYSNAGYVVAGSMLEELTGQTWEDLMRLEVFDPLGMVNAGFGPPGTAGTPPDQPRGHTRSGQTWTPAEPDANADNPAALGPAGTIHLSLQDYALFVKEHLNGLRKTSDYLTAASWDKMHTASPGTGYALGWGVDRRTWANGATLAHSGSNTLWFSVVWMAPARNIAFVAVTNVGGAVGERATDQAVQALILRAGFSF